MDGSWNATPDVALRLLGPPAVRVDGGWRPLPPTRPHALALFVAQRAAPVRRAEAAALLWPDADDARAFTNLRQALRALVDGPLDALLRRDRIQLWVDADVDATRFRAALDAGAWSEAFALHGGPFLDGFALDEVGEFGAWLESERAAVADGLRRAGLALVDAALAAGRGEEAFDVANRLLRFDPLDETVVRRALSALTSLGDHHQASRLFEDFRRRLADEMGAEPEAATSTLAVRARSDRGRGPETVPEDAGAKRSVARRDVHLVALAPRVHERTRLIGRDADVADLIRRIVDERARFLTLLGPGGVGKTTLAAAVADAVAASLPDGVWVARLDGVEGRTAVVRSIGRAANVALDPGVPQVAQLVAGFRDRRGLLLLDGAEGALGAGELMAVVDALVRGCPELTLLATSRARLQHSAEVVVDVAPLATDVGSDGRPSAAARLFLGSLEAHGAAAVDVDDRSSAERIVRRLGGTPLAIELVAAWSDLVPLAEVEERLERSWELLRSDDADRFPRQHDVQAIVEEAWSSLAPEDQAAWARLAVLPGTVDRAIAAEVAGTGWRGLRRLADRAVLRRVGDRLELHALLARYGRERAGERGLVDGAWDAALLGFRPRLAQEVEPQSGRRRRWHDDDLEQALGAWRRAVALGAWAAIAEMAHGLVRALDRTWRFEDRRVEVAAAVAAARRGRGRARDSALARLLPFVPGGVAEVRAAALRAWALGRRLGDDRAVASAVDRLLQVDPTERRGERVACALAAFERAGDRIGSAALHTDLGEAAALLGRHDEAEAHLAQALDLHAALGDDLGLALAHDLASTTPLVRGDVAAVRHHVERARGLFAAAGAVVAEAGLHTTEAWLALIDGDRATAEAHVAAYEERMAHYDPRGIGPDVLRLGIAHRFGTSDEVIERAPSLLVRVGAPQRTSILGVLASLLLGIAHARLGDADAAADALRPALRMARELDGPRFVAHTFVGAAELARARGERGVALDLAARAWHHPALEFEQRRDLEALVGALKGPWPPPAPNEDDEDDRARLARVEALLGGA